MKCFPVFLYCVFCLVLGANKATGQCITNSFWQGGTPTLGTLTATGFIMNTVQVDVKSQGTFAADRPGYITTSNSYGGFNYRSLMTYRGASFAAGTNTSFKLATPLGPNYIHIRVSDIRGDGFNLEHQRVTGFLNGVSVPANFVDPQNGAYITGGNVINGAPTTTPLVQSSMRAFFTGPVDNIVVTSTSLSDYVIIDLFARCDIILPFRLLDFKGRQNKESIQLDWKTGLEENMLAYEIQHSPDGVNWKMLGSVPAFQNDQQTKHYTFSDNNPSVGKNYYRLMSKETDGQIQYSPVIKIKFELDRGLNSFGIFPNPVNDQLSIRSAAGNEKINTVEVYTLEGKRVFKAEPLGPPYVISTKNLQRAVYLLKITSSSGNIFFHKLIKE